MQTIDMDNKFVAIKMTFGELGNIAYLRPNYAKAVVDKRPQFHISLIVDVSPNCDCHSENDAPILPNIGMFASFDPVALDQACVDACQKAKPIRNSQLGDNLAKASWISYNDHFMDSNPNVRWKETLEHAEKIGIGTRDYELIVM